MPIDVHNMTITYDDIKPWGRSLEEYTRMFSLTHLDLKLNILGCGDGPASFNAEMVGKGGRVISVDPIYQFSIDQIRQRIQDTYADVIRQTRNNEELFIWDEIGSVEALGTLRMSAMRKFLADFEEGKRQNRYIVGELPSLPFDDKEFDLALCSHFLFLYTDNLSLDFHLRSVQELCRVAHEVRIFPLLDTNAQRSRYLDPVIGMLKSRGLDAVEKTVAYEFQRGGNQMLEVKTLNL